VPKSSSDSGRRRGRIKIDPSCIPEVPLNHIVKPKRWNGVVTYGLICRCGHRAIKKMTAAKAKAARFKCSKCGRTQTRERTADATPCDTQRVSSHYK